MLENKWGLRLIALALAILFFLSVNNVFGNMFDADKFGQNSTETLNDVPVEIKYNHKDLFASGAPETVNVELTGSRSQIIKAQKNDDIKAILDLTGEKAGQHSADFEIKGLDDNLDYEVKPKEASVNLEQKVSKKMKVEPDVSEDNVDADYKISQQSVSPQTVKVTGGEKQLRKVAYLKATYKDTSQLSDDTTDVANITAFDNKLNKLDVAIQPKEVNLTTKLAPYSKKVKINPKIVGKVAKHRKVDKVNLNQDTVEIYGNKDDLKDINEITGEIHVDDASETTDKEVNLKLPDEVTKAEPKNTKAEISIK
ncbi:CdaR family protein [Staphylococcus sp. SQ8-PEA]|uniref:CdaR family protein n=1 Tax=Staphylococcus marylandisciuri TaxID=2981529 RepID=A0ABT2QRM0_9STAP|nr:CdaR family protein [Staphylococcus marylandisciuri]MCU5746624.1 CdaR family protein [Staphylococcus marylandisciuri]